MLATAKLTVLIPAVALLSYAAMAQAPLPDGPKVTDVQREKLQHASAELTLIHDELGNLVSDCSGGHVMVRTCGANPSRVENACHEPLTSCEVVDSFRATGAALDAVKRALAN